MPSPTDVIQPIERVIPLLEQPITFVAASFFVGFVIVLYFLLREKDRYRKTLQTQADNYDSRAAKLYETHAKELASLRSESAIQIEALHAESRDMLQKQTEAMLSYMDMMETMSRLATELRETREIDRERRERERRRLTPAQGVDRGREEDHRDATTTPKGTVSKGKP